MFSDREIIMAGGVILAVVVLVVVIIVSGRRRRDDDLALTGALMRMQETTDRISTEHVVLTEKLGANQNALAERLQQSQTTLDQRLDANQNALAERLQQSQTTFDQRLGANQNALAERLQQSQTTLDQRLDALHQRLGDGIAEQTKKTGESLSVLHERLAVIDAAQQNITDLSQQMVGLQDILSNKQARGAFGEIQLNDLVIAALPPNAYEFQRVLGNGKRPDCLLLLPLPPGPIAIDAKFPLESFEALRAADNDAVRLQARRAFATDVKKHVIAIAEKYIIPGETAESALMFLPSEAVFAELHASFRNVIEESFQHRVWIVSPTTLMATLITVRAILRDVRMKEQAGVIQDEVVKLMKDVIRLDKRVGNLRTHFTQAGKDIGEIETSTQKITSRGEKIEAVELGDDTSAVDGLPTSEALTQDRMID